MYVEKTLKRVILLSGVISCCNLIILYFIPMLIPIANFTIIKLTFIALVEKKYSYILISCLLLILIFVGVDSIKRKCTVLSIFSFAVYVGDLIHVAHIFAEDLFNNYINTVVVWSGVVDIFIIVLFVCYFIAQKKIKAQ